MTIVWVLRSAIGAVLIVSAAGKLVDLPGFGVVISRLLHLRPESLSVRYLALGVCLVELVLGVASASALMIRSVDVAIAALLAVMLAITVYGAVRYPAQECHCFGALDDSRFGWTSVLRDSALLAAAVVVSTQADSDGAAGAAALVRILSALGALLLAVAVTQVGNALRGTGSPADDPLAVSR